MDGMKNYDNWKTKTPEPEEPTGVCFKCENEIYKGDGHFLDTNNGKLICDDICLGDYVAEFYGVLKI